MLARDVCNIITDSLNHLTFSMIYSQRNTQNFFVIILLKLGLALIRPTFNSARGADIKNKARQPSSSTSVAIAMSVSLCSIRKNQTLLL